MELAYLDCRMVEVDLVDDGYLDYGSYDGDRCSSLAPALVLILVLGRDDRVVLVHAEDVHSD